MTFRDKMMNLKTNVSELQARFISGKPNALIETYKSTSALV